MHVYIVFAHPSPDSFNREVLDTFTKGLQEAGHPIEHLEKTGIAESMQRIMLNDRLLGIGVKEARMEILGGMMPQDDTYRQQNLEKVYHLGRNL